MVTSTAAPLSQPVQFLKGVGPKRAEILAGLGVVTVEDLLHYYPRDWQDRIETKDLSLPTATGIVVLQGRVVRAALYVVCCQNVVAGGAAPPQVFSILGCHS